MKLAIMQPYFFPYIGYFQLINSVDCFVIYDNIEFSKKGWINRNRILENGTDVMITVPLKKASDYLNIDQRNLSESFFQKDRDRIIRRIENAYRKAPEFQTVFPIVKSVFYSEFENLFQFLKSSLIELINYLQINTDILVSSSIDYDTSLKSQDKVLAICKAMGASQYINAIGGKELYNKTVFENQQIDLRFIKTKYISYPQFHDSEFVPWLSIIDVMMFNKPEKIEGYLEAYDLL